MLYGIVWNRSVKNGFGIKWPTKVCIPLKQTNKQTNKPLDRSVYKKTS